LFICDADGRVLRANDAALRITGHTTETALRQNLLEAAWNRLADDDEASRYAAGDGPLVGAIKAGKDCSNIAIKLKVKEEERILSVSSSQVHSLLGETVGAIAIIRDITEEHRNGSSEGEHRRLLAHELKSPLAVISGYAQLIERRLTKQGRDDEAGLANRIQEQVIRMSATVSDLMESGPGAESH
jgi:PAS domain S-box-containing protein